MSAPMTVSLVSTNWSVSLVTLTNRSIHIPTQIQKTQITIEKSYGSASHLSRWFIKATTWTSRRKRLRSAEVGIVQVQSYNQLIRMTAQKDLLLVHQARN
jgi:hypothetical protein